VRFGWQPTGVIRRPLAVRLRRVRGSA
jgi:hypothetical protein